MGDKFEELGRIGDNGRLVRNLQQTDVTYVHQIFPMMINHSISLSLDSIAFAISRG